jgi:hypothetical protein
VLDGDKMTGAQFPSGKALEVPASETGQETRAVGLSEFCLEEATRAGAGDVTMATADAIRAYLDPERERRIGWGVPDFQRAATPAASAATLEISLELRDWARLEAEAARQEVSEQLLIRHAVTYAAAQRDGSTPRS